MKVGTNENAQSEIIFNKEKINVNILLRVLTNKISQVVQWSKPTHLQPIITFFLAQQGHPCPIVDQSVSLRSKVLQKGKQGDITAFQASCSELQYTIP